VRRSVRADRALADAAFARRDSEDAGRGGDLGVRGVLARVPARLEHDLGPLLARHLAPLDPHVVHTGVGRDARLDVGLDLGTEGAAADGELDLDGHDRAVRAGLD
jgi:hypothetical protein